MEHLRSSTKSGHNPVLFVVLLLANLIRVCHMVGRPEEPIEDERGENEKRLIFDLFEKNGYNHLIRPVRNTNDPLNIRFNLALSQIISVDEVDQVMKTNVWLQVYWNDYQLKWDPVRYGNIQSLKISFDKVWVPDFVLFNNADGNFEVTYKSNCVLRNDSLIYWVPPAIFHSSCSIDVKYFPFDEQICEMKFGSWSHKGNALKYSFYQNMDKLDLTDYLKSGSWDIIDGPGRITTHIDEVTGETKEQIIFQFRIRRKSLFYTVNLIIPCLLISFVTICVFAIPADAGSKTVLCISVLLAQIVFQLLVVKILPPSETTPLFANYLLFTFMVNLVAILSTVIITNRNFTTPATHRMPHWARVVFLRELPKYLLMTRPNHDQRWRDVSSNSTSSYLSTPETPRVNHHIGNNVAETSPQIHRQETQLNSDWLAKNRYDAMGQTKPALLKGKGKVRKKRITLEMTPELRRVTEAVKLIYEHLQKEDEFEMLLEDWKFMARVLDRLLMLIFTLIILVGTASILLNVPHILEFVDQDKIIKELIEYISNAKKSATP